MGGKRATAQWCIQVGRQMQFHPVRGRLFAIDNFYTFHVLGRPPDHLSDLECRILGTVRFKNIDCVNRPGVDRAMDDLSHAERGLWKLSQAFHNSTQRNGLLDKAKNCGYIVFKERAVVVTHSNVLKDIPLQQLSGSNEHTVLFVPGVSPMLRWLGNESS